MVTLLRYLKQKKCEKEVDFVLAVIRYLLFVYLLEGWSAEKRFVDVRVDGGARSVTGIDRLVKLRWFRYGGPGGGLYGGAMGGRVGRGEGGLGGEGASLSVLSSWLTLLFPSLLFFLFVYILILFLSVVCVAFTIKTYIWYYHCHHYHGNNIMSHPCLSQYYYCYPGPR